MVSRALSLLYRLLDRRSGRAALRLYSALHFLHWWCIELSPALRDFADFASEAIFGSPFRSSISRPRPWWDR